MDDLELTKLCAQAMGLALIYPLKLDEPFAVYPKQIVQHVRYDPLHDDAQAMALVKTFRLIILSDHADNDDKWQVSYKYEYPGVINIDLNRAIIECVAKMQLAEHPISS